MTDRRKKRLGSLKAYSWCVVSLSAQSELGTLRELAAQGDADAQVELALRYLEGDGVLKDSGEAARLYGLAAEQGHAAGQVGLGWLHVDGNGVEEDNQEAATLGGDPHRSRCGAPVGFTLKARGGSVQQ